MGKGACYGKDNPSPQIELRLTDLLKTEPAKIAQTMTNGFLVPILRAVHQKQGAMAFGDTCAGILGSMAAIVTNGLSADDTLDMFQAVRDRVAKNMGVELPKVAKEKELFCNAFIAAYWPDRRGIDEGFAGRIYDMCSAQYGKGDGKVEVALWPPAIAPEYYQFYAAWMACRQAVADNPELIIGNDGEKGMYLQIAGAEPRDIGRNFTAGAVMRLLHEVLDQHGLEGMLMVGIQIVGGVAGSLGTHAGVDSVKELFDKSMDLIIAQHAGEQPQGRC